MAHPVGARVADTIGHLLEKSVFKTRSGLESREAFNLTIATDHTLLIGNLNA
jgi:hypothetical protein